MASTFTPNLNLELMGTGDHSGTWGGELNSAVFTILDNVLGNLQAISLSSSPVTINTAQSQNNCIQFTGALTADVTVTFPAIGRTYFLINSTTGAHNVTIACAGLGTSIILPQGAAQFITLDAVNVRATSGYFLASAFRLRDASDQSKVFGLDLSGISTGQARSVIAADASGTMILANTPIGGQFQFVSSTVVALKPLKGNVVAFPSGAAAVIPSGGISSTITNASINGLAAQTLAASTLYYAYLWNSGSGYIIDWSTTVHATDANTGIEIKLGDATRVLVGMAYPQAGPVFADSATARLVATWFNRVPRQLSNVWGSNQSTSSGSFVELNSNIRCVFLSWNGTIDVFYAGSVSRVAGIGSGVGSIYGGPAIDSSAAIISTQADMSNNPPVGANISTSGNLSVTEGMHFLTYFGATNLGVTITWLVAFQQGVLSGNVIS